MSTKTSYTDVDRDSAIKKPIHIKIKYLERLNIYLEECLFKTVIHGYSLGNLDGLELIDDGKKERLYNVTWL